jgi:toxin-antitoxin system PIN domain toxin
MILVDTNLLVFATMEGVERHADARRWLEDRLAGPARVGLPWGALLGFARVVATPRIFANPMPLNEALRRVRWWLAQRTVWVPEPTERHAAVLADLLARETRADLVPDAHLAALAIEHGLVLCSSDRDFSRFEGLRWQDPLRG